MHVIVADLLKLHMSTLKNMSQQITEVYICSYSYFKINFSKTEGIDHENMINSSALLAFRKCDVDA